MKPAAPETDPFRFSPEVRLALRQGGRARAEAQVIVKNHVIAASGLSLLPLPLIDGVVLGNVQFNLISRLADHYGVPFAAFSPSLLLSVMGGSLPFLVTTGLRSLLKFIPGPGSLAGSMLQSTLASAITYALGRVFLEHFDAGGTLDDINLAALRQRFRLELRRELKAGRGMEAVAGGG